MVKPSRALALAVALASAGCSYVRSAVRERLHDDEPQVERREEAAAVPRPPGWQPPSVRDLDDSLFSSEMVDRGFFDPHAFLERAADMVYGLEPQDPARIPVVFVHGIRAGPRDFAALLAGLDRKAFQPWFFYYPSGAELADTSEAFHRLFLSGKAFRSERPMVIVAHSMGGLVVREALNRCVEGRGGNRVARLVTLASPMGGLSSAGGAADGVLVIRSWRDLDPRSLFVQSLHRRPLPKGLAYHLFFTYGNGSRLKFGENSDGVVTLGSQLAPAAQDEATTRYGLDATHTSVLHEREAVRRILDAIRAAPSAVPQASW